MSSEEQTLNEKSSEIKAGLFLTFALGEEMYGLEILAVQEIIQMAPITVVPRTPEFVRGVINLRGKVIPVIDLRKKFEMETIEDTEHSCIIVVEVGSNRQPVIMGIVVDQVAEVLNVANDQVEPPPVFGTTVDTDFIQGMGKVHNKVIILLDIRRVLGGEELAMVNQMIQKDNEQEKSN